MASSTNTSTLEFGARPQTPSRPVRYFKAMRRFARQKPLGFAGLLIVIAFLFVAVFTEQIAPYRLNFADYRNRLEGSSSAHLLGTDNVGKDTLSQLIYGARISMVVGFGAMAIAEAGAVFIGVTSGYIGGWFDKVVQRFVDAWQAMPGLIILITILGIIRRMPDVNLVLAMLVTIGVLGIPGRSRFFRSQVLTLKEAPYVEAAKALGASGPRIIMACVIPNLMPLILVSATVGLGGVILTEASLSFLGFGPAGEPSWGQMLSTEGREYMRARPGLAIWPGVCIGLTVFAFNIFGDALRDVLDPRLRQR